MAPLVAGITKVKGLKTVKIDLSRAKVETEAFEMLADALLNHSLEKISFNVESMKINPQNIANMASAFRDQNSLTSVEINLNFNEIDVDDIKLLVESLDGKSFESLVLKFKGCGLPRDAFTSFCDWLNAGVEVSERLIIDLTM